MKRRHAHWLFATAATAFALAAAYQAVELKRAERVNAAVASASRLESNLPEAVFARAAALSTAGNYEGAVKAYKTLVQNDRRELGRDALYNLGNLHLRESLKKGANGALESLPLIELAKQAYRDVLREEPGNWDARYNLERALWLAPEVAEEGADQNRPSEFQRRVMRALPDFKLELP